MQREFKEVCRRDVLGYYARQPVLEHYEEAAKSASSLREKLEWDWDGSLRKSQPALNDLEVVKADVPLGQPGCFRNTFTKNSFHRQSPTCTFYRAVRVSTT